MEIGNLKGKELSEYLSQELDELADNICQDPDELERFVKQWNNGFHSYSLNNTLLILSQRPDSTLVAGYRSWQERGRQVLRGEFGIRIFAPNTRKAFAPNTCKDENAEDDETIIITGFHATTVFAIQQTGVFRSFVAHGRYLHRVIDPDPVWYPEVGCSDLITGEIQLDKVIEAIPVPIVFKDLGFSNGKTDGKVIYITPKKNKAAQVNTIIHEYSHVLLHFNESTASSLYDSENRSIAEIEAESVAFIVTSYLGLKNLKSALYVGNWGANSEKLKGRGKRIISTAEAIIRDIESLS
ncbi:MAG: ImmA/IrrE family metallo-endopeptidase [Methanobacterium sp.]|nr:ImmA/IrrE family metallo-endopeptidase [Methanobacterium sp.]